MIIRIILFLSVMVIFFSNCGVIKNSPKYQLANGYYKSKSFSAKTEKVYIDNEVDTVYVYKYDKQLKKVDTSASSRLAFADKISRINKNSKYFRQPSFDVDFVTMPFKYRPTQRGFPQQFNTSLNGAVYFGFRNDVYQLKYRETPLKKYLRQTTHYGFSFGLFTGIGGAVINPWVTNGVVGYDYDGVAWSKGISAIIGINNFTLGLALGFDNLLDENKDFWIYQQKPWLGLAFGLNLN
ncbi:MAG: hypothetical protein H0U95_16920 [Bacteroidetes bacterium]|nr:hypothetical protein [Bacteroidota bacterium]